MKNTRTKSGIFYLISALLPIVLLALIELSLRAANYGDSYPLFVDVAGKPDYMQPNEAVIGRFFADPQLAPKVSPDTQFFLKDKPSDSYRIVVQGGSTAAGFPFGRWGSLSGMLQQRFKRLYPEKQIEIINTAMASVNTYALVDFVDEIVAIQPDLVLVYAGHNEYLGVMGVGSAFAAKGGRTATLLYLTLKEFRLYRLVESLYYQVFAPKQSGSADERTLMAKVAKEKNIPLGSPLFEKGIEQFAGNLDSILKTYSQHSINVMVGNLASNEKDHIPFSAIEQISPKEVLKWKKISQTNREERITQIQEFIDSADRNLAANHYELAQHFYNNQDFSKAKHHFSMAKDHDLLRFRAPEVFNQTIEALTTKHSATLVDVQKKLREDSHSGIIDAKLMLEHLHPTAKGYFLLANAFADKIIEKGVLGQPENQNEQLAWQEMPITKADNLYGEFKVARLMAGYPFRLTPISVQQPGQNTIEGKAVQDRLAGESWLAINQKLSPIYQRNKDLPEAALISGLLSDALPDNFDFAYVAGLINKRVGNLPFAVFYLNRAIKLNPQSVTAHLSLAQSYFLLGKKQQSLHILQWVKSVQPTHPRIDQLIDTVQAKQ